MKRFVLFIGLCGLSVNVLLSGPSLFSPEMLTTSTVQKVQNEEVLELHGTLAVGVLRSLIPPVEVSKSSSCITIHYLITMSSSLYLTILDATQQSVYADVLDPVAGEQLVIDISAWLPGDYTLYITNNSGGCLYGSFELID